MHRREGRRNGDSSVWQKWLSGVLLAAACLYATAPMASAETRTLKLYYTHTREKAEITFKKNGRYVQSGLKELNNFLRDWRRNEPTKMDPRLFDLVWETYRAVGGRDYIHIVSAYRSPATNAMLRKRGRGVANKSQHMLGKAMDFYIPGVKLKELRNAALRVQGGGVGYYPTSGSPFVHLDVGNVRHWPRMSRSELASVFPNGKTLHVPTDGKPLAGYDVALAQYKSRKGAPVAMASEDSTTKRSGGFLSALFGGGADEEEETGGAVVASAPAREAAPAPTPKARTPLPEAARMPQPEIELAAAPQPKPSADVAADVAAAPAEPAPPSVAAMIADIRDGDLPMPQFSPRSRPAPAPEAETAVALADTSAAVDEIVDVPVPLPRPAPAIALASTPAASAGEVAIETILAADSGIPVPVSRPQQTVVASLGSVDGAAPAASGNAKGGRLVAAARPATVLDAADPVAALRSGPATTPKAAKPSLADGKPDPRPVQKAVDVEQATRVLAVTEAPPVADKPDGRAFAFNTLRAAPTEVYTDGFRPDTPAPNPQRFSGKAVTFLSVAKFRTTTTE